MAVSTSSLRYDSWCGGSLLNNNQIFFGFQAPDGAAVTRVSFDSESSNVFAAFDDLAFRVSQPDVIPEPCTMALLALGGLVSLVRRRRR